MRIHSVGINSQGYPHLVTAELRIRRFAEANRSAVVELWRACALLRSWNDPDKDIDRKIVHDPDGFLVGEAGGRIVATTMAVIVVVVLMRDRGTQEAELVPENPVQTAEGGSLEREGEGRYPRKLELNPHSMVILSYPAGQEDLRYRLVNCWSGSRENPVVRFE